MEKIKASEVLKRVGLKYTWMNDGCMVIASTHPKDSGGVGRRVYLGGDTSTVDYDSSTYEIDFSEDFSEERLSLINRVGTYLAWQLDSDNYNKIKWFFEEMESPDCVMGSIKSGRITAENQEFSEEKIGLIDDLVRHLTNRFSYENSRQFFYAIEEFRGLIESGRITAESQDSRLKIEKIALSEVLERTPTPALERVKFSRYVGFYENGGVFLSDSVPSELEVGNGLKIYEIDHSDNDGTKTVPVGNIVAGEFMLQGMPVFKDFDGKLRPIGDLGRIVISSTKESRSIFQEGDIVHVLSYSNQGELGVSTQGVVKAIKSNSFIAVEIVNGIEEVHEEKNISFAPFSIHEAGFSQVRPQREIKEGDWGFFYDNNETPCDALFYGRLELIKDGSCTFRYKVEGRALWRYFSHTPPQLAEGIPNPFKEC